MNNPRLTLDTFVLFTIYKNPSDHPSHWVTRRWIVGSKGPVAGNIATIAASLAEARAAVPDGFENIGREPSDDPAIYEVWV